MKSATLAPALDKRVVRDEFNAEVASSAAACTGALALLDPTPSLPCMGPRNTTGSRFNPLGSTARFLEAIAADPFQAMVEVYTEVLGETGSCSKRSSSGTPTVPHP